MTHILTSGSVTPPVRYTEEGTLIMPDWNITQRNLHNKALKEEFAIARLADPSIIGINAKGASLVLLKERCDFCHGNRIAEISYYIDGYLYEIDSADLPIVEILPVVRSMH